MSDHHIVIDLGEKNIKGILFKRLEGGWTAKEYYFDNSNGIKDGSISNYDILQESIKKCVYEIETSARINAEEISFIFSLENIVEIKSISEVLDINGVILPQHTILDFQNQRVINEIYTSFTLDNVFRILNPVGLRCGKLTIHKKVILCSDHIITFFNNIFKDKIKVSFISFANAMPNDHIICDIGYNSTRIRTKTDMIIIPKGSKEILNDLAIEVNSSFDKIEKRVCLSYLIEEKMIIIDKSRKFFQSLFSDIFHYSYQDIYSSRKIKLCGLGCFVPFLCDFVMELYYEQYGIEIEISLVTPELYIDCSINKNCFFFCNEVKNLLAN